MWRNFKWERQWFDEQNLKGGSNFIFILNKNVTFIACSVMKTKGEIMTMQQTPKQGFLQLMLYSLLFQKRSIERVQFQV